MRPYGIPRTFAFAHPDVDDIFTFAHKGSTGGKDYFRGSARRHWKAAVRRAYKRRARAHNSRLCKDEQ